jgi:31-O-methyltransferase
MTATTPTPPMRRMRLGALDLSVIDPFDRDSQYIYDEIFVGHTYAHPKIVLPERSAIIDVGANIGLCSLWMAQTHHPRTILAYEASPTTHRYLADNVARYVDAQTTAAQCFNLAVSHTADSTLELHQPPWTSGRSTILDGSKLPWVDELRDMGELNTHKVRSTTVSREMAVHGLATVDLLKIDVEGYFMEVLDGIAPADRARIRNIILEAEYVEAVGHSGEQICALLRDWGFTVEAQDAAQIMIYAWRS